MTNRSNHELDQQIVSLPPEQGELSERQGIYPATTSLGEMAVGSAMADTDSSAKAIAVAELPSPDEIPSLLPQLERIESAHSHLYSDSKSVYVKAKSAEQTPSEERTVEQKQVLEDVETMRTFAPYSSSYEDVYTSDELHSLTSELALLSQKNRPDFNGVESRILDVMISELRRGEAEVVPQKLLGIVKRAENNTQGRRGMQWDTLIEMAKEASKIVRIRAKGHTEDYFVSVKDPEPKKYPDLSKVYQFVADIHALDIVGKRQSEVAAARQEAFVTNCSLINQWFERVAPVLDRLPRDFKVGRFSATLEVRSMVESMNNRLNGSESRGKDKDYRLDPAGAISLQKKIGHTIEAIKTQLSGGGADETEIVPLDK